MRKLYVKQTEFPECCGISVICEFPDYWENSDYDITLIKKMSDNDWFGLIRDNILFNTAMYTFVNSSGQNAGGCTPSKLARWLRKQGEKVYTGASAVNPKSQNTIVIYSWAPSKKFRSLVEKYKKKNQENAQRGTLAA